MKTAIEKLHPRRFPNMSPQMAAIVSYILGKIWTDPYFDDICVTSDGFVLAQTAGDIGMNNMIGSFTDLQHNWESLLNCAGLSKEERRWADQQFNNKVMVFV